MLAVWLGPKTVIAWSHQQCSPSDLHHWSGQPCNWWSCAVGWELSQSRCWRWVRAAIGGTQVEPLVGRVGAGGAAIGAGVLHTRLVGGVGVSQGRQAA
jgi:hypothetical protein